MIGLESKFINWFFTDSISAFLLIYAGKSYKLSEFLLKRINFKMLNMKKAVLVAIAPLVILSVEAQNPDVRFIDSVSHKINMDNTILLFSELPDTVDIRTGLKFSQRNSYYFDWRQKELRLIDVYKFDKLAKKHMVERAFRKNKKIPSGTEIQYVFFRNDLVKVKVTPSEQQCRQCSGEYYFSNDELIFKNEQHYSQQANNFIRDASFFLARLEIRK